MGFGDECSVCGANIKEKNKNYAHVVIPEGFLWWFGRCLEHLKCDVCGEYKPGAHSTDRGYFCPECHQQKFKEVAQQYNPYEAEGRDEITCPYCGCQVGDSWECSDYDDDWECGDCLRTFKYERHVSVTYSSYRKDDSNAKI